MSGECAKCASTDVKILCHCKRVGYCCIEHQSVDYPQHIQNGECNILKVDDVKKVHFMVPAFNEETEYDTVLYADKPEQVDQRFVAVRADEEIFLDEPYEMLGVGAKFKKAQFNAVGLNHYGAPPGDFANQEFKITIDIGGVPQDFESHGNVSGNTIFKTTKDAVNPNRKAAKIARWRVGRHNQMIFWLESNMLNDNIKIPRDNGDVTVDFSFEFKNAAGNKILVNTAIPPIAKLWGGRAAQAQRALRQIFSPQLAQMGFKGQEKRELFFIRAKDRSHDSEISLTVRHPRNSEEFLIVGMEWSISLRALGILLRGEQPFVNNNVNLDITTTLKKCDISSLADVSAVYTATNAGVPESTAMRKSINALFDHMHELVQPKSHNGFIAASADPYKTRVVVNRSIDQVVKHKNAASVTYKKCMDFFKSGEKVDDFMHFEGFKVVDSLLENGDLEKADALTQLLIGKN